MMDSRTKMLIATITKLFRRGAEGNIRRILDRTHTADIASVLENLETEERISIFQMVRDVSQKAEIVSYLSESLQEELLSILDSTEVQVLVSQMDRDDAADLLRNLPEEVSKSILNSMVQEDSQEVEELMSYPEDSAGAMMSSEVFSLKEAMTVAEAVQALQKDEGDIVTFYVYVANESDQLVGVLSLKQLLLFRPSTKLKDIMSTNTISVAVSTSQADVARIVEKYDFLSLPVVDETNKLVGVITVDDVIDVIREEAEEDLMAMGRAGGSTRDDVLSHFKARFLWSFLSFLGGVVCYYLIYYTTLKQHPDFHLNPWWNLFAIIPLMLTMGSTTGHQATTLSVGSIRSQQIELSSQIIREAFIAIVMAGLYGSIIYAVGYFFGQPQLGMGIAGALALQILLTQVLGTSIPYLLLRLNVDPATASVPLLTAFADILAVTLIFSFAVRFVNI